MFKTILACATGHEGDGRALKTAFTCAKAWQSHVDCVHVRLDPVGVASGAAVYGGSNIGISDLVLDALRREDQNRTKKAHEAFETACRDHAMPIKKAPGVDGASAAWHEPIGDEFAELVAAARFSDLLIVDRTAEFGQESLSAVIVAAGRPVLIPATSGAPKVGANVAIAWKETAETARAVTAAMPLLERAQRVIVVAADEAGNEAAATLASAERLAASLRWHGIKSEGRLVVPGKGAAAGALFGEAKKLGAELVVMGAYGHSRVRELIFGGFTRAILNDASALLPVLLFH